MGDKTLSLHTLRAEFSFPCGLFRLPLPVPWVLLLLVKLLHHHRELTWQARFHQARCYRLQR